MDHLGITIYEPIPIQKIECSIVKTLLNDPLLSILFITEIESSFTEK